MPDNSLVNAPPAEAKSAGAETKSSRVDQISFPVSNFDVQQILKRQPRMERNPQGGNGLYPPVEGTVFANSFHQNDMMLSACVLQKDRFFFPF